MFNLVFSWTSSSFPALQPYLTVHFQISLNTKLNQVITAVEPTLHTSSQGEAAPWRSSNPQTVEDGGTTTLFLMLSIQEPLHFQPSAGYVFNDGNLQLYHLPLQLLLGASLLWKAAVWWANLPIRWPGLGTWLHWMTLQLGETGGTSYWVVSNPMKYKQI